MGKKSNLYHQATMNLQKQIKFGESKHLKKQLEIIKAKQEEKAITTVKGIYSYATYESYAKACKNFIQYCVIAHGKDIKSFYDCQKYVAEYLESNEKRGLSPFSIGLRGSALASAYDVGKNDFGYIYPVRTRAEITRCRSEYADKINPQQKYDMVKIFCRATGSRRREVLLMRKNDYRFRTISTNDNIEVNVMEVFKRGKGGIERWTVVLPEYREEIKKIFEESKGYKAGNEERLFNKHDIPNGSLHQEKAEYASRLYKELEKAAYGKDSKRYYCRKEKSGINYNKEILKIVSQNCLHSRIDVIANHYLWKM